MGPGVTVKVYGLEDIRKQTAAVREKMRELNRELGKLERALCMEAEIGMEDLLLETDSTDDETDFGDGR